MNTTQWNNHVFKAPRPRDKRPVWVLGIYLMVGAIVLAAGLALAVRF